MMTTLKTIALTFLAAASVSIANAGDFLTDFDAGKAQAKKEKKPLLVKFTGSDWCHWCQILDKEVFGKSDFKKEVEKDFVVVVLDYPQNVKQDAKVKAANKKVLKAYKDKVRGYPTVLLMDSAGKVFKTTGYQKGGVKPYLAMLKKSLKATKFR